MKNYTAKDIVIIYSQLKDLTPHVNEWSEELFQDSPPRLIRLQQLIALKKAFAIPGNLSEFELGNFILLNPISIYSELEEKTLKYIQLVETKGEVQFKIAIRDVVTMYRLFLEFVVIEYSLKNLSTQYSLMNSIGQTYSSTVATNFFTETNNEKISGMIGDLSIIIDPTKKIIPLNHLIANYAFPIANLEDLDLEYW